jgi:3-hydroxyacyl-CoA dehydrogenase
MMMAAGTAGTAGAAGRTGGLQGAGVAYEVVGAVALLSIRNPPVNSLSSAVFSAIKDAVQRAGADPQVVSIVLLGDGRTFPVG